MRAATADDSHRRKPIDTNQRMNDGSITPDYIRQLEAQAEAFLAKLPTPKRPAPLSAPELAQRIEDSGRRGWVTPHGQFIPADSNACTITLGPFTISGHAAAVMTWLPGNDPVLHRELENLLYHGESHPASAERSIKRFMFQRGYIRVANGYDCLEFEGDLKAPKLRLAESAARELGVTVNIIPWKKSVRRKGKP